MVKNVIKIFCLILIVSILTGCLGKDHMPEAQSGDYEGKVIDSLTEAGIPGVTVSIGTDYQTQTDANGEFTFQSLAPGTYQVVLERQWYNKAEYTSKYVGRDDQWKFALEPEPIQGALVYSSGKILVYLDLMTRQTQTIIEPEATPSNPVLYAGTKVLFDAELGRTDNLTDIYVCTMGFPDTMEKFFFNPDLKNSGHPSVDTSGTYVVFQTKKEKTWYVMLYTAGGSYQTIAKGQSPAINPAGTMIAYIRSDHLYIYQIATGQTTSVNYSGKIDTPAWRPKANNSDPEMLAVEAWTDVKADSFIALVDLSFPDMVTSITKASIKQQHGYPCWSADGSLIFFAAKIVYSSRMDIYGIRLQDALDTNGEPVYVLVSPGSGSKTSPNWVNI